MSFHRSCVNYKTLVCYECSGGIDDALVVARDLVLLSRDESRHYKLNGMPLVPFILCFILLSYTTNPLLPVDNFSRKVQNKEYVVQSRKM